MLMKSSLLIFATESSTPLLDLFGEDLTEDGSRLTDLMAGGDKVSDTLRVTLDPSKECLVAVSEDLFPLIIEEAHLLVNLGREAGHKRLNHGAE